jgi:hypothetical protein
VRELIAQPHRRQALAEASAALVDGLGVQRVVQKMQAFETTRIA